ncbi:MAG TPA: STAS domain-containing protein [Solirubrobacteraceae bacterium]|nr:STAS domain-containing protein [Solirubrobacteraceae bacterium]
MAEEDRTAPQLDVERRSANAGTQVLALSGELDVGTVHRFHAALHEALEGREAAVVVADLTQLTFMDSSGLAAMLGALREVSRAGGRLLVACANPTVLRVFHIAGTDATFEISPTVEQALERARR